jgi:hypothetical protein
MRMQTDLCLARSLRGHGDKKLGRFPSYKELKEHKDKYSVPIPSFPFV